MQHFSVDSSFARTTLVTRVPEIWEPADPELAAIFAAIPQAVGTPGVHGLWRLLANVPQFLKAAWPEIADLLASEELGSLAARLRRASFISQAVGMPSHKAFRGDMVRAEIDADFRAKIERFNDLSQLSLTRLLAASVTIRQCFAATSEAVIHYRPAQRSDLSDVAVYVPPLRSGEGGEKARELLARIRLEHDLPFLDDYYRSLARVPEYLGAAWNAIRPLVGDPVYLKRAAKLPEVARGAFLGALAGTSTAFRSLGSEQQTTVQEIFDLFADTLVPQTLIDVTLIKALTSGPARATLLEPPIG